MPTKIFDQLDLINITEGYVSGPFLGDVTSFNFFNNSYSDFQFVANGSYSGPFPPGQTSIQFSYIKNADIDFTKFPAIPTGALVTQVTRTVNIVASCNLSASLINPGTGGIAIFNLSPSDPPPDIPYQDLISMLNPNPNVSANGEISTPVTIAFDPPLPLADFITFYNSFLTQIATNLNYVVAYTSPNTFDGIGNQALTFNWHCTDWRVEVTYIESPYTFSIDTESPVTPGQEIDLSSSGDNPIDYEQVDTVTITYTTLDNVEHTINIPSTSFTNVTQFSLTFTMPDIGDAPTFTISISGRQFSGSVTLGTLLTINFTDGTGIYKLDLTATHDTLYVQDYDPVQTVDVKIPNPLAKTAFIP